VNGRLSAWFDDDLADLARTTRVWASDRIEPLAAEVDRSQAFSTRIWAELRDLGVFGLALPEAMGGAGASALEYVAVLEQIAYASGVAALYPGTTMQVAQALIEHAEPETAQKWVPRLVAGEAPAAWAFTEPGTGSDPRQLLTRARHDGDGWIISGQKAFVSYAAQALVALVFARTTEGEVTAFLIETRQEGWRVGGKVEVMAFGGTGASTVHLDDIRVTADQVVGGVGDGFKVMLNGESFGKVRVSAINVGVAQRALDVAAQFARDRLHRGEPIGEKFPSIQSLLADMQSSVLAARAMLYDVSRAIDRGANIGPRAAALRLVTGRAAREVTSAALQVCGAYGMTTEMPVERLYREAKFYEVAQGSAEIQRVIVGKHVLKAASD
jgi:alkylation response protein AidB-like acyl-CoA dehydrogenase